MVELAKLWPKPWNSSGQVIFFSVPKVGSLFTMSYL